jgi:hypothetical protein
MDTSKKITAAAGRINHRAVNYSNLFGCSALQPKLANLSPLPPEFGAGGDLIGRFSNTLDDATPSPSTHFLAARSPRHSSLITTKTQTPVIKSARLRNVCNQ